MNLFKNYLLSIVCAFVMFTACNDDDDDMGTEEPQLTGENVQFNLVGSSGVSGTATFAEMDDNSTQVTIDLNGTTSGGDHPAHIHMNSAAERGGIAIDLSNVDGATGTSVTIITTTNDNTSITYDELIVYDGYINVHNSADDLGTLIAQGDIGINALTGESETYELFSVSDPNITGEAVFSERASGETLIEISLSGDAADSDHPAHIHMNTAAEGGGIAIDLTNVMSGVSRSSISALNDGTGIAYDELIEFDGYINVHNSASDLGTLVAQGDIGQNTLTGESESYALNAVSDPTISGTANFEERVNGETLITISLTGTAADGDHPAHIHMNDASTGGGIAMDLSNVNGSTGISKTNATALNDGTAMTYDDFLQFNGYINVHNSSTDLGTFIAQGNIGSNVN